MTKDQQISYLREMLEGLEEERKSLEQKLAEARERIAAENALESAEIEKLRAELVEEREKRQKLESCSHPDETDIQKLEEALAAKETEVETLKKEKSEVVQEASLHHSSRLPAPSR